MKIKHGDILSVSNGIIVHQVNAQGVMGSGLAKQIREKYPMAFDEYHVAIKNAIFKSAILGSIIPVVVSESLMIVNVVAQCDFGRDKSVRYTSYDALDLAFKSLSKNLRTTKFDGDINIPEIGAGLGNGNFQIIQEIILSHLTPNFEEETGNEVVFWKYN